MTNNYVEHTDETIEIARRIIERFAGDVDSTMANLSANGIVVGKVVPKPIEDSVGIKDAPTETEQPKEWIEHQEEERRAWAINSAIEVLKYADSWNQDTILELAEKMVVYVKGSNPDLNDVEATDTFYLVLGEMFEEREASDDIQLLEDFLIKVVDRLAKEGVRLKDGKRLEDEA